MLDLSEVSEKADFILYGNAKMMELAEYFNIEESILMEEWEKFKTFYLAKTDISCNTLSVQKLTSLLNKFNITDGDKFLLLH